MAIDGGLVNRRVATLSGLPVGRWKLLLFVGDVLSFAGSLLLCAWAEGVYFGSGSPGRWAFDAGAVVLGTAIGAVLYIVGAYEDRRDYPWGTNLLHIGTAVIVVEGGAFLLSHLLGLAPFTDQLLPLQGAIFLLLICGWRYLFSAVMVTSEFFTRTLIVGAGSAGRLLLEVIRQHPSCGLLPVGLVDDDPAKVGTVMEGLPVLGTSADLPALIEKEQVSLVVVAFTCGQQPPPMNLLSLACRHGVTLLDMPSVYEALTGKVPNFHISGCWFYHWHRSIQKQYYARFKSIFEPIVAAFCLLALLPLFILIALAIKLDSKGKVFYVQERLGKNRLPFKIIKFRTMVENAEENGPQFSAANDPRITRVGRILRKFRLDELPQLLNILKGDMSFIGPRPERQIFCQEYLELVPEYRPGRRLSDPPGTRVCIGLQEKIPLYGCRFLVKPGLTGWAQVMHKYTSSLEETNEKLQYDLYYIKNIGLLLDIYIIFKTIKIVLSGKGT